ncbi:hypothetical protein ACJIZ3_000028 [Penstemon smallii]|uniref:ATP-dependent DNA helicase n=1 Tax=Penstemon smallii TaxID=265156 RepID=A0ABD3RBN9_9LAMI
MTIFSPFVLSLLFHLIDINCVLLALGHVGRRTVLPSSFVGSPRDMYQRYQDAMAIVQKFGKPDIFLTMTCNPNWKEIQEQLLPGQTAQDRPDLLTRIFRAKYEELNKDIYTRGVLGKVIAHVHVVEFQKRGLPHVHMLIILDEDDKLSTPDDYNQIVRAEIPHQEEEPKLYEAVMRHMIHGPCGLMNTGAPCMQKGKCKKGYPKAFAPFTAQGNDSYPIYQHRDDGRYIALDLVPYNSWLLLKYDCHINVEICSSIKSIKYLYKYVYKGPDCVVFELRPGPDYDEVSQYVDGRWICAPEAFWKIFKFPISKIYPSVVRLQVHLPNMQQVQFYCHQRISDVLNEERNQRTMLTDFFRVYNEGTEENQYLYRDFPRYYRWLAKERIWQKRRTHQKVIGRMYAASPGEGERFYLRLLLNHVRGPKSFDDLLTINGVHYLTFKQAAEKMGLLEEDDSIHQCLVEARSVKMPSSLRRLFATILLYCEPAGVRRLWDENCTYMIEDYPSSSTSTNTLAINRLLHDINKILAQHNRSLKEFDLPQISEEYQDLGMISSIIQDELTIPVSSDELNDVRKLNPGQLLAFNTIKHTITSKRSGIFFVDGPGGTGKTFLYRALLASFRNEGCIMLATATSGIAANQLSGGRTAHSKLKIPIKLDQNSMCRISKQSELCHLLDRASAIIWDEAPMANRHSIETVEHTLRDMLGSNLPFGGKVIIFGGDFRQVVPVVVGATRSQTIRASIIESSLWSSIKLLHLTENVRAQHDQSFSEFLLRVGNGEEPFVQDDMIKIPNNMAIPWEDLSSHTFDVDYMMSRALITPLNDDVNKLNEKVIQAFPGEDEVTYYSFDSVSDNMRNLFLPEFLNSLSPGSLPPHKLTLKKGCPIMLLRNIDPKIGLCNGTRLICHRFGRNVIDAEILTGQFKGTRVFLPRMPLRTSEDAKLPFEMTRRQFPIRLSFALTINKSQGQTIPHVGIYLPDHVFSHGQLYVALSRGVSQATTKVLAKKGNIHGLEGVYTRNVVFPEIYAKLRNTYT